MEEFKQKAINRIKETTPVLKDKSDIEIMAICHVRVEDYIAGATENGIQWHDLRKDPKDLPKENKSYRVYIDFQGNKIYRSIVWQGYWLDWYDGIPLAWCEEPQFKE